MYHARTLRNETQEPGVMPLPLAERRLDLSQLPQRLWAGRWRIAATGLFALLPGLMLGLILSPRYGATVQVLIDPVDLQVVDKGLKASSSFGDVQLAQLETQTRVLSSQSVLKPVIERHGLASDPEFATQDASGQAWLPRIKAAIGLGAPAQADPSPQAEALRNLQRATFVRRTRDTFVLDVTVTTKDAGKSVRLANAIVDAYLHERAAALSEVARRVSGALTARVAELKERVEQAEYAVQDFKRAHNLVSTSGLLVSEQQLGALSRELIQLRVAAAEAKARHEQVQQLQRMGADPGAMPDALRSQALSALRAQYGEARGREGQLSAMLLPGHPALVAVRGQVGNIRSAIREEVARVAASAEADYQRTARQERALESAVEALRRELTEANDKMVRLRELERDAQAQRSVYEGFLIRTREIDAQEKLDVVNARVIARAEEALRANWPPRLWQVLVSMVLLGVLLASATICVRAVRWT